MKFAKILSILLSSCLLFLSCSKSSLEPENQFVQIYFKYGFRNELNTFANTYQKDLVLDGVIKVGFWLTDEEQIRILEKANEIEFFSLPDTLRYVSQNGNVAVSMDPDPGEQVLRIKHQWKDKATVWTYPLKEDNDSANAIMELRSFIVSAIETKPEYKRLPPARGGYL
jgi:hypothetical protein